MNDTTDDPSSLPQGSLSLLTTDTARVLLDSTLFAHVAYTGLDGLPRIVPTWFHWTGDEFVMPTFVSARHIRQPAARLRALQARPHAALTIGRVSGEGDGCSGEDLFGAGRVEREVAPRTRTPRLRPGAPSVSMIGETGSGSTDRSEDGEQADRGEPGSGR